MVAMLVVGSSAFWRSARRRRARGAPRVGKYGNSSMREILLCARTQHQRITNANGKLACNCQLFLRNKNKRKFSRKLIYIFIEYVD